MRNGTKTGADMPDYPKVVEMEAYERLPEALRIVLREAPFDVSAADMVGNQAVVAKLEELGPDGPTWLAEQLMLTYRNKILASS